MMVVEVGIAVVEEVEAGIVVGIVVAVGGPAVRTVGIVLGILAEVEMTAETVVFEMGVDIGVLEMHLDILADLDPAPEMDTSS